MVLRKIFVAKFTYEYVYASMCMSFAEASATQLTCMILTLRQKDSNLLCACLGSMMMMMQSGKVCG